MKRKTKRIAALFAVFLLVALYVTTLIVAIFDFPYKERLMIACALGTIIIPILLWVYIWIYGRLTGTRTIATVWPEDELPPEKK